jgi:O-antigen/teichoic acid export membrane protein
MNSLARMPSLILLAAHRPDLTAKIHLVEVPFYCLFLWWILPRYGVEGAAVAWTLRISSDMAAFFFLGWRLLPQARATIAQVAPVIAMAVLLLCGGFAFHSFAGALPFIAVVLASAGVGLWRLVLRAEEKALIRGLFRSPGVLSREMRKSGL